MGDLRSDLWATTQLQSLLCWYKIYVSCLIRYPTWTWLWLNCMLMAKLYFSLRNLVHSKLARTQTVMDFTASSTTRVLFAANLVGERSNLGDGSPSVRKTLVKIAEDCSDQLAANLCAVLACWASAERTWVCQLKLNCDMFCSHHVKCKHKSSYSLQ